MSYGGRGSGGELSETFQNILDGAGKFVAAMGGLASLAAIGFLIFLSFRLGGSASDVNLAQAAGTIGTLKSVLMVGVLAMSIGSCYLFWGSEILGVVLLILAAALFFAPMYMPSVVGSGTGAAAGTLGDALGALAAGGVCLGIIAIIVIVIDLGIRMSERARRGTKVDQLKYGKGIREEKGKKNVFLGKCWQLPFCREFVRERCPIYHAKTTCWKELVGCMCEESVIRNAMENKPIPKDALLASKMIPRNNRLTEPQKKERCRNCVIYNEHQRHKYKAAMPTVFGAFVLVYATMHGPLIAMMNGVVTAIEKVIQKGAALQGPQQFVAPAFFTETLLAVFFIVGLSYAMKTVEFLIFRAKI
jgi:hypothetical protein